MVATTTQSSSSSSLVPPLPDGEAEIFVGADSCPTSVGAGTARLVNGCCSVEGFGVKADEGVLEDGMIGEAENERVGVVETGKV